MEPNTLSFKTAFKKFLVDTECIPSEMKNCQLSEKEEISSEEKNNPSHESQAETENTEEIQFLGASMIKSTQKSDGKHLEEREYHRKLFIANLHEKTTEDHLEQSFQRFGEIEDAVIIRDRKTGYSRGLGYVLFHSTCSFVKAVASQPPEISNRQIIFITPKENETEPEQFRKLSVGNLGEETTAKDLKLYFKRWGEVLDSNIMKDEFNKSKGYGFITFELSKVMIDVLSVRHHILSDRKLKLDIFMQQEIEPEYLRKIIVKYLNPDTTEVILKEHFEKFGRIKCSVIMRGRKDRKSRGLGYVIFEKACMVDAVRVVEDHWIDARPVTVFFSAKTNLEPEHLRKLFIRNLNYETTEDMVTYYFEQFGRVESCFIARKDIVGQSFGKGYVIFEEAQMVAAAISAGPHKLDYRKLVLSATDSYNQSSYIAQKARKAYSSVTDIRKDNQSSYIAHKAKKAYSSVTDVGKDNQSSYIAHNAKKAYSSATDVEKNYQPNYIAHKSKKTYPSATDVEKGNLPNNVPKQKTLIYWRKNNSLITKVPEYKKNKHNNSTSKEFEVDSLKMNEAKQNKAQGASASPRYMCNRNINQPNSVYPVVSEVYPNTIQETFHEPVEIWEEVYMPPFEYREPDRNNPGKLPIF